MIVNTLLATYILAASTQTGVPVDLITSILHTESRFRNVLTTHDGGSPSYGYGQIKMKTARFVARRYGLRFRASDMMKPERNVLYTAYYLKYQMERYSGRRRCAIEAYNKGSARSCSGRYVKKVTQSMYYGNNLIAEVNYEKE